MSIPRRWQFVLLTATVAVGLFGAVQLNQFVATTNSHQVAAGQRIAAIETVRSYQSAISHLFRTGESDRVASLLSSDFVDSNPAPGFGSDSLSYVATLETLAIALPNVAFEWWIESAENETVRLQVIARLPIGNFPVVVHEGATDEWSYAETLELEDGKISGRRGPDIPFPLPGQQAEWSGLVAAGNRNLQIEAWVATGGFHTFDAGSWLLLLHGNATVTSDETFQHAEHGGTMLSIDREELAQLEAGDLVYSESDLNVVVLNPSRFIVIDLQPVEPVVISGPWGSIKQPAETNSELSSTMSQGNHALLHQSVQASDAFVSEVGLERLVIHAGESFPQSPAGTMQIILITSGNAINLQTSENAGIGDALVMQRGNEQSILAVTESAIDVISIHIE